MHGWKRMALGALVALAAQDVQAAELRAACDALLDIVIKNEMNPRLVEDTRSETRNFLLQQLAGVRWLSA